MLDQRLVASAVRLIDFPESGRQGRVALTRELVVIQTPYVAVYTVHSDRVTILRVFHAAQEWPDGFGEEPSPFVA